jgi:hypothetical protein
VAGRHRRLWLLLHQRRPEDVPPAILAPFRPVQQQTFAGQFPFLSITVALYERR